MAQPRSSLPPPAGRDDGKHIAARTANRSRREKSDIRSSSVWLGSEDGNPLRLLPRATRECRAAAAGLWRAAGYRSVSDSRSKTPPPARGRERQRRYGRIQPLAPAVLPSEKSLVRAPLGWSATPAAPASRDSLCRRKRPGF